MTSLSREQMRACDREAIETWGLPGIVLMENAGRGCAEIILGMLSGDTKGRVVIACGKGNNGGDGYVIARHLLNAGVDVSMHLLAPVEEITGDARTNLDVLIKMAPPIEVHQNAGSIDIEADLAAADLLVDALLGTGVTGSPRPPYPTVIEAINACATPVVSIDIPSGLDADTGRPSDSTVRATVTATMAARKKGFDNPDSRPYTGRVEVVDIGMPRRILDAAASG